jgi:putative phage-type endonuclease
MDDYIIEKLFIRCTEKNMSLEESVNYIYNVSKKCSCSIISKDYIRALLEEIHTDQKQLQKLLLEPGIVQRTTEWYERRKGMITSSDMALALGKGKFQSQRDFIIKKCGYEELPQSTFTAPLDWGVKYEPVACSIYSSRYNVKIFEFGLLEHSEYKFFGASPDGISETGIALELKCPWKRKIDGSVPEQYFYQIQGQLEVCNVGKCDYVECKLSEYENEEKFLQDVDSTGYYTSRMMEKGIIIEKIINQGKQTLYSPLDLSVAEKIEWLKENTNGVGVCKVFYWKLDQINIVRIKRDPVFFAENIVLVSKMWDKIKELRSDKEMYTKEIVKCRRKTIYDFKADAYEGEGTVKLNGFSIIL